METTSSSDLPPLYDAWMKEALPGPIPRETLSPCLDCVMCPKGGQAVSPGDIPFDSGVKCCTYVPFLRNFLVGRVLRDEDPAMAEGRASVEARIDRKAGVTPVGLEVPFEDAQVYDREVKKKAFGRHKTHRCPHYIDRDGGLCGVWKHRNAICSTWFCRYVRGRTGRKFWKSLSLLITRAEGFLGQWCLSELGMDVDRIATVLNVDTRYFEGASEIPEDIRREMWGPWLGREREWYRECARVADSVTWARIESIGGAGLQLLLKIVRERYRALMEPAVPSALKIGVFEAETTDQGTLRVWGYNKFHPIDFPMTFMNAPLLVGPGPTEQFVQTFSQRTGIRLTPQLLRTLLDHSVLASAETDQKKPDAPPVPMG